MTSQQAYSKRSIVNVDAKNYLVNEATGEVEADVSDRKIMLYEPRKNLRGAPFVTFYQADLVRLANCRIPASAWRVLIFVIGVIDYENWLLSTQRVIADHLGMEESAVSKHLKQLVEAGLLSREGQGWAQPRLRLSGHIAWKGTIANLRRAASAQTGTFDRRLEGSASVHK